MNLNAFILRLESWDIKLFLFLNGKHDPFFDLLMGIMSDTYSWVPLYLGCLYWVYKKFNFKTVVISLLAMALVILFCDRITVIAFKEVFKRYRPCHNLAISHFVHTLNGYCGGLYGFVSSHAANSFGLALFFGCIFRKDSKWFYYFLLLWASLVSYSRIYLGVHYPADVVGGAFWGIVIGWIVFTLFNRVLKNT